MTFSALTHAPYRRVGFFTLCFVLSACGAGIPQGRYGVQTLRLQGMEEMDERSLRSCLGMEERGRTEVDFGLRGDVVCGEPPFARETDLRLKLWNRAWEDWPVFDRTVFERDLERVERWYRARGYYDARVTETSFSIAEAAASDRYTSQPCESDDPSEGCPLDVVVQVEEGQPTTISSRVLVGLDDFDSEVQREIADAWKLRIGDRFDEALYDRTKRKITRILHDAGYGCAEVAGQIDINPAEHSAGIRLEVTRGPLVRLRHIEVSGQDDLSSSVILAVADLREGDLYTQQGLDEAQHFVYSLGTFASVEVIARPLLSDSGQCTGEADVEIHVTPGRRFRYGLGLGVLAGTYSTGLQSQDVRQWDVHLLGFVEHRNFLGGLRRMRLEVRPKLVFQPVNHPFPAPRFGTDVRLQFRQPSFLEARTNLVVESRWDFGPEPNDRYFRHLFEASMSVQRSFFDGKLSLAFGPQGNLFRIVEDELLPFSDYQVAFLRLTSQLDLRDDSRTPTKGFYAAVELDGAALLSWDYVRVIPEIRGYLPLGRLVLAARARLGILHISRADGTLDPVSAHLGPQQYRLRSGGASSHRGFLPGYLGDPPSSSGDRANPFTYNSGGLRRWEASLELRAPVTENFGLVFFADMGDVHREASFRFNYIRLALGGGLRYDTIVGPVRFDVGIRVPGAQIVGEDDPETGTRVELFGIKLQGAFHLTIGEAF